LRGACAPGPASAKPAPPTPILSLIIAVGPVSMDMYLPAFTQIARDFGNQSLPQLTLSFYLAGLTLGQLPYGPVSDRIGRRPALAVGLALYTLASIGCALAPTAASLCGFRALAGFGGAASIVIVRTITRDLEPVASAAALRLYSIFAWLTLAPLLAPLFGSAVLHIASWRMIFAVAALYGLICLLLLWRRVPETMPAQADGPRPRPFGLGGYATILRDRGFLSNALIGACAMSALFTYLGGSPAVFLDQEGFGTTAYSCVLAAIGAGCFVFLRFHRRLVQRRGWTVARAIDLDLGIFALGSLCLLPLIAGAVPWPIVFIGLLVAAAGFTAVQPNAQAAALADQGAQAGSATAAMSTLQYGGGALANAALGWLADGTGRPMAIVLLATALAALLVALARPRRQRGNPGP
jgi:DHA1 family bicyclomycin/chloramphenicol resistance-like MFS transporter